MNGVYSFIVDKVASARKSACRLNFGSLKTKTLVRLNSEAGCLLTEYMACKVMKRLANVVIVVLISKAEVVAGDGLSLVEPCLS
jgi:hypothetical protein